MKSDKISGLKNILPYSKNDRSDSSQYSGSGERQEKKKEPPKAPLAVDISDIVKEREDKNNHDYCQLLNESNKKLKEAVLENIIGRDISHVLPDVTDMPITKALAVLKSRGISISKITHQNHSIIKKESVISCMPELYSGDMLSVQIIVSKGPAETAPVEEKSENVYAGAHIRTDGKQDVIVKSSEPAIKLSLYGSEGERVR